jgi:hypothetical protein
LPQGAPVRDASSLGLCTVAGQGFAAGQALLAGQAAQVGLLPCAGVSAVSRPSFRMECPATAAATSKTATNPVTFQLAVAVLDDDSVGCGGLSPAFLASLFGLSCSTILCFPFTDRLRGRFVVEMSRSYRRSCAPIQVRAKQNAYMFMSVLCDYIHTRLPVQAQSPPG